MSVLMDYRLQLPAHMKGVEIYAFGGYQEVGRNCFGIRSTVLNRSRLVDCGRIITRLHETDDESGGDEYQYLPAFEGIRELWDEVDGVFLTHMHLDHVGSLPHLYRVLGGRHRPPVLTSPFTAVFTQSLFEPGQIQPAYYPIEAGKRLRYNQIEFRAIAVPHSTRQTRSFLFYLPDGRGGTIKVLFVSDFKFADCRLTAGISEEFVRTLEREAPIDILIYDALYKGRSGMTRSEDVVRGGFREMKKRAPKGLIASCFASNLDRIEMMHDETYRDRMVCYSGRSMRKNIGLAKEAGWLADPEGYQEESTVLLKDQFMITTGAQGEKFSVLDRLSRGEGPFDLRGNESFGIMADPIPGNEGSMKVMIEGLAQRCPRGFVFISPRTRRLCQPVGENIQIIENLHVSGHGAQGDHDRLLALAQPRVAIEYHHPANYRGDEIIPD